MVAVTKPPFEDIFPTATLNEVPFPVIDLVAEDTFAVDPASDTSADEKPVTGSLKTTEKFTGSTLVGSTCESALFIVTVGGVVSSVIALSLLVEGELANETRSFTALAETLAM